MSRNQPGEGEGLEGRKGDQQRRLGDTIKGGGQGTIADRRYYVISRETVGNSARHVLGPGTPESPSTPRLYPLQAGGQFGLFVFKQHLLLSNNKRSHNSAGRCSSVTVRDLPRVEEALGCSSNVYRSEQWEQTFTFRIRLSTKHEAHTNADSVLITSAIPGSRQFREDCLSQLSELAVFWPLFWVNLQVSTTIKCTFIQF